MCIRDRYIRREIILAEVISGDPNKLIGQTITKSTDSETKASVSEVEIVTRNRKTFYKISLFVYLLIPQYRAHFEIQNALIFQQSVLHKCMYLSI